jgi:hypothetical protein
MFRSRGPIDPIGHQYREGYLFPQSDDDYYVKDPLVDCIVMTEAEYETMQKIIEASKALLADYSWAAKIDLLNALKVYDEATK